LRINAQSDKDGRLKRLARAMGYSDVEAVADAITELKFRIGLKNDLTHLNLTDGQIEQLVKNTQHPSMKNNPVPITEDILRNVYRSMVL
jgi:alcohol dehydrogenase